MLNFVIWRPFCFSKFCQEMSEVCSILRFGGHFVFNILSKFVQTVHTNFHVKSGLCSSRNERVMLNFVIWRPFCFSKFCQNLFGLSIRTNMQSLQSVAQKMSELWYLVRKGWTYSLSYLSIYIQAIIQSKLTFAKSSKVWTTSICSQL